MPHDPVVDGTPDIALDPESLDFGIAALGAEVLAEVGICNQGGSALEILDVAVDEGEAFGVEALGEDELQPGLCTSAALVFAPTTEGAAEDLLWVESNDPEEPFAAVDLFGEGVGED